MIKQQTITYQLNGQAFEGVICWDDNHSGKRPGVLVAHAWFGQSEFEVQKAKDLASLGYVAFALDMYGKGRRAQNEDEAGQMMNVCVDDSRRSGLSLYVWRGSG